MTSARPVKRLRRFAADTRPLAVPAFRRTVVGQGAAVIGTMVTEVAVPVQVYDISRSSFDVGLVGLAGLVPILVFGLYGGAVADAVDRRRLTLGSSVLTWSVTLALLTQALAGLRSVPLLLALVAVQAGGFAVSSSVRGAITPALLPVALVPAANALSYTVSTVGQVLGPVVAGVLIGLPGGFGYAYGADAVLFTAALYAAFRLPPLPPSAPIGRPGLRAVVEGLRFLAGRKVLLMSFLVDIAAMVLAMPRALFPEAADTRWPGGAGLLYSSIALGAVVAGVFSGWIGRVRRQGMALIAAVAVWGCAVALAGVAPSRWLAVCLLGVAGAADLVSAVYRQTILQTSVPDHLRGRLQGVFTVVVAGGPSLGDLRAGALAAVLPLTVAWSAPAVLCVVLVVVGGLLAGPFRRYTQESPEDA